MRRRGRFTVVAVSVLSMVGTGAGVANAAPDATTAPGQPSPGLTPLTPALRAQLSAHPDRRVIVVLKDQLAQLPDNRATALRRTQVVGSDQAPIITDLRQTGSKDVKGLTLVNDVVATVSAGEARRLAADPAVARVVPDVNVPLSPPPPVTTTARGLSPTAAASAAAPESACQPGSDGVELDPEALSVIHADSTNPNEQTARKLGFDGSGVTVAYMAEQSNVTEPGFVRANGHSVFTDYKDFTGEGATTGTFGGEAVLDASTIAAQGNQLFQITLPSGGTCTFRVEGVAPGANLVGIKVFPQGALAATTSSLLEGIDYAVTVDHVNVLNESFGYNPLPDTAADLIRQADTAATNAGTVVVSSTGDAGPTGTFGSPSTDPAVISAGATTTYRTYAQADIANYHEIGATGWIDNNMSALSSAGLAEDLKSPDVVAPGDLNWALYNPRPGFYGAGINGGTSEAAPLTAATAALVIQAYRQAHGGASPTPALVKEIITSTTDDLGNPGYEQGTGLLDSYRAVEAALSVGKTGTSGTGAGQSETLLTSTDQLAAAANPGTRERFRVAVTNNSSSTQVVHLHGRVLSGALPVKTTTVVLGNRTGEHFNGLNAQKVTFHVPPGAARLEANIAAPTNDSSLSLALLNPLGKLVAYSLPQGVGNHGHVEVRYPAFGTWTAWITDAPPAMGGYAGPVDFEAGVSTYHPFGQVTPSRLTLRGGQSATVTVTATTPAAPGDLSAAVELDAPFGRRTSIPVDLRSLVPLRHGIGAFSTLVTGGNGRGGGPAVEDFYQFDVPAGAPALDVQTAETARALDGYDLYLVDPQGETVGHTSNQVIESTSGSGAVTLTQQGARAHVLHPAAGRWTLVAAFPNPVAGTARNTVFAGVVDLAPITATAAGLPDRAKATLPAGKATRVAVTIHNNGLGTEAYFLDARQDATTTLTLPSYTPSTNLTLPQSTSVPTPQWIVPTETTRLVAAAVASGPVTFDWAPYTGYFGGVLNGDPDLGSLRSGDTAQASWAGNPVTPGDWEIDPEVVGPFGASPAPTETANLAMTATTKAFDTTVQATTGDFWSTEAGQSSQAFTPVLVGPGQTVTLEATITPTAAPGTVVNGTLYVDDASSLSPYGQAVPSGQELTALPYHYTVAKG